MFLDLAGSLLVFSGVTLGLAWPVAAQLDLRPAEKLTANIALSLLGVFLVAWVVYIFALPLLWLWLLPLAATTGLVTGWRSLGKVLRDPEVSQLAITQIIVTLWSVGGLALVLSYSGGGWLADWFGHMQRTWFFLDHGPHNILFNGFDALTSRPPLANVVNGAFLTLTQRNFAHYQLFGTLFGSLAFLPVGLLARRWGGSRAIWVLVLLFMVNPMYAQNVTYAWTKLPAAFFTLAALYFFLRAHDENAGSIHGVLFALTLAAGLLTHYSAGPYAVLLGAGWIVLGASRWRNPAWWRTTIASVAAGTLILATWFGWTFKIYGLHGSLLTNTSITDKAPSAAAQLQVVMLNVRDTFVPHFFRTVDFELLAQRSSSGWWRDWFFQLYQVNFFFAFGCVAWGVIAILLLRQWSHVAMQRRGFWLVFIAGNTILGVAVHGARETWGLAHICLQPLVLLGLAFLAARWTEVARPWRLLLIAGATVDFLLGIVLQFGAQAYALERWFSPTRSIFDIVADYSRSTQMNFFAKTRNHWVFVGDLLVPHTLGVVIFLAGLFLYALRRVAKTPAGTLSYRDAKGKIRAGE